MSRRSLSFPAWFAARAAGRAGMLACAVAACGTAAAAAAPRAWMARPSASVALVECITTANQAERAATFAGEMTAIGGSARMEMRIDLLERAPQELFSHTVVAPGLGVWRFSTPGVKVYKYVKQVTNLSAPAFYRAAVRFRWLSSKGKVVRALQLRTPSCQQPASAAGPQTPPAPEASAGAAAGASG